MSKKYILDLQVLENKKLNSEYFELVLTHKDPVPEILPGQFAEIRIDDAPETFLRRPISFYDVDYENNIINFLIQIVGKGTYRLSSQKVGEHLNTIFPLGNSFTVEGVKHPILVGGGVGIAPLLFLGHSMHDLGMNPIFLLGFRTMELLVDLTPFEKYGEVYITTDDGSAGEKGVVTNHSILKGTNPEFDMIYTCGPEVMMKSVSDLANKIGINAQASLENTMACGFGACLCCVQKTTLGNKIVCTDGPVFNTRELVWQT